LSEAEHRQLCKELARQLENCRIALTSSEESLAAELTATRKMALLAVQHARLIRGTAKWLQAVTARLDERAELIDRLVRMRPDADAVFAEADKRIGD
jgi:hypothetical protein